MQLREIKVRFLMIVVERYPERHLYVELEETEPSEYSEVKRGERFRRPPAITLL